MNKEEAMDAAEKLLLNVMRHDMLACASIVNAVADKNTTLLASYLTDMRMFCDKLMKALEEDEQGKDL